MSKFEEEFFSGADFRAIYSDISKAIADLRQHSGLSLEEAAQRIGMQPDKLEAIERGQRIRSTVPLVHIVETLGGRLTIIPTDNPGVVHIEFMAPQSKN